MVNHSASMWRHEAVDRIMIGEIIDPRRSPADRCQHRQTGGAGPQGVNERQPVAAVGALRHGFDSRLLGRAPQLQPTAK